MAEPSIYGDAVPSDKGLLQTPELYEYLLETSVYPREADFLKELRQVSTKHPMAVMGSSPDVGQLVALILKVMNAKNTIEVGVFTGYSVLLTALTIPDDGKIIAIDVDRDAYEMGLPVIKKAGVDHKIEFIESQGLPALERLLEDPKNKGAFDFAFVDADKDNYINYHEKMLELVRPDGVIIYDNTLWGGTVAMPEEWAPSYRLDMRKPCIEFNKRLAADTRVQISQVSCGDGITVCRRL